jgi:hypothetical protein
MVFSFQGLVEGRGLSPSCAGLMFSSGTWSIQFTRASIFSSKECFEEDELLRNSGLREFRQLKRGARRVN